jgi:hypothetical protein
LAELVKGKTEGNPFFVNEFLKTLYAENLLVFTPPAPLVKRGVRDDSLISGGAREDALVSGEVHVDSLNSPPYQEGVWGG